MYRKSTQVARFASSPVTRYCGSLKVACFSRASTHQLPPNFHRENASNHLSQDDSVDSFHAQDVFTYEGKGKGANLIKPLNGDRGRGLLPEVAGNHSAPRGIFAPNPQERKTAAVGFVAVQFSIDLSLGIGLIGFLE